MIAALWSDAVWLWWQLLPIWSGAVLAAALFAAIIPLCLARNAILWACEQAARVIRW